MFYRNWPFSDLMELLSIQGNLLVAENPLSEIAAEDQLFSVTSRSLLNTMLIE